MALLFAIIAPIIAPIIALLVAIIRSYYSLLLFIIFPFILYYGCNMAGCQHPENVNVQTAILKPDHGK